MAEEIRKAVPDKNSKTKKSTTIVRNGIWANIVLVVGKIVAGIAGNSTALIADAAHSLSDFITDIAVIIGIYLGNKPVDKNHNYGHGKIETLVATIVGLMVAGTGAGILFQSGRSIYKILFLEQILSKPGILALIGAGIAIIIKEILFRYTVKYGRKYQSEALVANAWHHRSDVVSTIGVFIGVGAAYLLGNTWSILDPIAAVILSIIVIISGIKIAFTGISDLVETSLDSETQRNIYQIAEQVEGALEPHNLRTRKVGSTAVMDLHIYVARENSIVQAHNIASEVEKRLKDFFKQDAIIYVHVEPAPQN